MPRLLDTGSADFEQEFRLFLSEKREASVEVDDIVAGILDDVQTRGDAAVLELTEKFDRMQLTADQLRITEDEIDQAMAACDPETLAALQVAADRITAFHERQYPKNDRFTDAAGVELGARWTAVEAVGLYTPGGLAAYPSSLLMNAIPARVAGVPRVMMCVPTPDGEISPLVLAASRIAGVTEIYRVGGAQAVGAMAFGTETIKPVAKIVGPGNAFVAAAKRRVYGKVGIDMIAGPSEILVVADNQNDPAWIAADLLSQSEHDTAAQGILITDDRAFADQVANAVETHLGTLSSGDRARESWQNNGAIILTDTLENAVPVMDRIAAEHLELALDQERADDIMAKVRNAGAIFLGRHTPEAISDYVAGPNHVLPTARSAKFSSGLNVLDFMKRTTFVRCDANALHDIGPAAMTLAEAEGLPAHALSIGIRINR